MELQYRLTASDYVSAQTAWLIRHPRALGRSIIPLAGVAVLVVSIPFRLALHPDQWRSLLPGLAWVLWPIGTFVYMRWRWARQFQKSPAANVDLVATLDERGVTLSAQSEHKSHYWAGFSRIFESKKVVVFEKAYGEFIYIPKRAMSSGQLEELIRLTSLTTSCKVQLASPFG